MEKEENSTIAFLDLKILRNSDGGLRFTVFRKETHTGLYLNFKSNNPIAHKKKCCI